jgi:hypothetical protein
MTVWFRAKILQQKTGLPDFYWYVKHTKTGKYSLHKCPQDIPNALKYTKWPLKYQMAVSKIHQIAFKIPNDLQNTKWPSKCQMAFKIPNDLQNTKWPSKYKTAVEYTKIFPLHGPSKVYQNLDFLVRKSTIWQS